MTRIKLNLPEKFIFHCQLPVRITDINYGNHLGNDAILSIIHEARVQFLEHYGCTELNVFGKALTMADAAIMFKSESFYGDVLDIGVMPEEFTRYGFDLLYQLTNNKTGAVIALAKTGMVCYNYEEKKVTHVPEEFSRLFSFAL